jgi:hypothetical protein
VVRAGKTNITTPHAVFDLAFGADRSLPEIVQNALETRRGLDHDGAVLFEVEVAHRVDNIRVRCGDERLGIETLLPNRQNVVTFAEDFFRTLLHGVHVECR